MFNVVQLNLEHFNLERLDLEHLDLESLSLPIDGSLPLTFLAMMVLSITLPNLNGLA